MKAPRFDYHAASSPAQAVELLTRYDGDAKVLAGGQSLVPLLNFRLSAPAALIDINEMAELDTHQVIGDELHVGAVCRHRGIEIDEALAGRCPVIADAVVQIGHLAIRNRGTVVGSIAHADPAAEWPGLALLLDAVLTVAGPGGERRIAARDFFEGFLSTTLEPTELVTGVTFTLPPVSSGSAWVEFAQRAGDFALVGVGIVLQVTAGEVTGARIVVTGASSTAVRISRAERALIGQPAGEAAFHDAAHAVAESLDPTSDIHADAAYRRRLAGVLTRRAFAVARRRAGA